MSHKATHWLADLDPRCMTNAEFRVLFVLCDCHNPSQGCFPKQEYLRAKTGRGNSSVNAALNGLEEKGLIQREQRKNAKTGKQENTHYILGFDIGGAQFPAPNSGDGSHETKPEHSEAPTPNSGDGTDSGFQVEPTPVFGPSRLLETGVVYKEEPVKEPVKEPCAANAAHQDFDFGSFFDRVWRASPRPDSWPETETAVQALIDAGERPEDILAAAEAYGARVAGYDAQRVHYSQNFFAQGAWKRHVPKATPKPSQDAVLEARAQNIREGKPFVCRSISVHAAGECITAGLVSVEDCHAVGIRV